MRQSLAARITAIILAIFIGLVGAFGYNFVINKNIRPQEWTLSD